MNKIVMLIVLGFLFVGCTATHAPDITHVYAFGDDISDTGNGLQTLKQAVAAGEADQGQVDFLTAVSWEGRPSNGPLAVEVLADRLNAGLTSYALQGAKSDYRNEVDFMSVYQNTGLMGQIEKFKNGLNGEQVNPDALFFISAGGYDLGVYLSGGGSKNDQKVSDLADQTIANISKAVKSLAEAGAKQFMVLNTYDLAGLPILIGTDVKPQKVYQDRLVSQMPPAMDELAEQLNVKINIFDFITATSQIRDRAGEYGLINMYDLCFTNQGPCAKPEEYYWWTGWSLTTRVHQILGEMMADQIKIR